MFRARMEADCQIQCTANIHGDRDPSHTRPELVALDSSRRDHHEHNRDTREHSVAILRRELKRRVRKHDDEIQLLVGICAAQNFTLTILMIPASKVLRFQALNVEIYRYGDTG